MSTIQSIRADLAAHRDQLNAELSAIEVALSALGGETAPAQPKPTRRAPRQRKRTRADRTDITAPKRGTGETRQLLAQFAADAGRFTLTDAAMAAGITRAGAKVHINKLLDSGEIVQVHRGTGRWDPSVYAPAQVLRSVA